MVASSNRPLSFDLSTTQRHPRDSGWIVGVVTGVIRHRQQYHLLCNLTIVVPLSLVDGARRRRASLFMARCLILCGTNLIVYDDVHLGVTSPTILSTLTPYT